MRLRRVDCSGSGLRRRRHSRGFVYLDDDGNSVRDRATAERVRSRRFRPLGRTSGSAQTPKDIWRRLEPTLPGEGNTSTTRSGVPSVIGEKFDEMLAFASRLPALRRRVASLLRGGELS
jgi:DNA topoisomerase-1